jgi:hypothetical protein
MTDWNEFLNFVLISIFKCDNSMRSKKSFETSWTNDYKNFEQEDVTDEEDLRKSIKWKLLNLMLLIVLINIRVWGSLIFLKVRWKIWLFNIYRLCCEPFMNCCLSQRFILMDLKNKENWIARDVLTWKHLDCSRCANLEAPGPPELDDGVVPVPGMMTGNLCLR